jgi:hypothetical protein
MAGVLSSGELMKTAKQKTQNNKSKNLTVEKSKTTNPKPEVYDLIGKRLRGYFEDVANQPVPGRFVELLNELEAKAPGKKQS